MDIVEKDLEAGYVAVYSHSGVDLYLTRTVQRYGYPRALWTADKLLAKVWVTKQAAERNAGLFGENVHVEALKDLVA